MAQLPLDLGFPPRYGAADFLVGASNAAAHALVEGWPAWPNPVALIVGPEGSGKTHLGSIWAERAGASWFDGAALARTDPRTVARAPALIDDADRLGEAEATLFHILNLARETGSAVLMTARGPPDRWRLRLADLLSRLRLAATAQLEPPDDGLMRAVLVKLFLDRQLAVDEGLIDYLALRLDRSLGLARHVVAALDGASLASRRNITRPIAAQVLAGLLDPA